MSAEQATASAPVATTYTTTVLRISELMMRYAPREDGRQWRVADLEKRGELKPGTYTDEAHARAGARLHAACDIVALFEVGEGR